jgi:hypothetical protein
LLQSVWVLWEQCCLLRQWLSESVHSSIIRSGQHTHQLLVHYLLSQREFVLHLRFLHRGSKCIPIFRNHRKLGLTTARSSGLLRSRNTRDRRFAVHQRNQSALQLLRLQQYPVSLCSGTELLRTRSSSDLMELQLRSCEWVCGLRHPIESRSSCQ